MSSVLEPLSREFRAATKPAARAARSSRKEREQYVQNLVPELAGRYGYQDLIAPDNPAAGANYSYKLPGDNAVWLLSVIATLKTSSTVADRTLTLEYRDARDVRYLVAGVQAALGGSQSQSYCWHPLAGGVAWPVGDCAIGPLPQQMLYPPSSVALVIGNAQPGDQLSLIRLSAYFYPTGQEVAA